MEFHQTTKRTNQNQRDKKKHIRIRAKSPTRSPIFRDNEKKKKCYNCGVFQGGALVGPGDKAGESRGANQVGRQDPGGRGARHGRDSADALGPQLRSLRQSAQLRRP